jgi:hypothetical protein
MRDSWLRTVGQVALQNGRVARSTQNKNITQTIDYKPNTIVARQVRPAA